ncbi:hypothetical protein [Amycolatopsis minnesotensis]|uniref:hypothetical protein n=1 Tax=Amycolatopsis minnesotensis TaxID=337894 RepID=UPI0031D6DC8D
MPTAKALPGSTPPHDHTTYQPSEITDTTPSHPTTPSLAVSGFESDLERSNAPPAEDGAADPLTEEDTAWIHRMVTGLEQRAEDVYRREGKLDEHRTQGPRLFGNTGIPQVPDALNVDLRELTLRQTWGLLKHADMVGSVLPDRPLTTDELDEAGQEVRILESAWTDRDRAAFDALPEHVRTNTPLPDAREIAAAQFNIWLGGPVEGDSRTAAFVEGVIATRRRFKGPMVLFTDVPRPEIDRALAEPGTRDDRLEAVWRMAQFATRHGLWVVNIDEFPLGKVFPAAVGHTLLERALSGPNGYVRASDDLRWMLGYLLGALYLDGDTILQRPDVFEQVRKAADGWAMLVLDGEEENDTGQMINNDAFVMSRRHPAGLHAMAAKAEQAEKTQLELFGYRDLGIPADLFDRKPGGNDRSDEGSVTGSDWSDRSPDESDWADEGPAQEPYWQDHDSVLDGGGPGLLHGIRRGVGPIPLLSAVGGGGALSWVSPAASSAVEKISLSDHERSADLVAKVADVLILYLYRRPNDIYYPAVRDLVARHENPELVLLAATKFIASVPAFRARAVSVTNAEFRKGAWRPVAAGATLHRLFDLSDDSSLTWRGYRVQQAKLKRPPDGLGIGGWRDALGPVDTATAHEGGIPATLARWGAADPGSAWWLSGIPAMRPVVEYHQNVHQRQREAETGEPVPAEEAEENVTAADFERVPGGVDALIVALSGKPGASAVVAGKRDGKWSRAWNLVVDSDGGVGLVDVLHAMWPHHRMEAELRGMLSGYDELHASAIDATGRPLLADLDGERPRWDRHFLLGTAARLRIAEAEDGPAAQERRAIQATRLRSVYRQLNADGRQVLIAIRSLLGGLGLEEAVETVILHAWGGNEALKHRLPSGLPSDPEEFVPAVAKAIALDVIRSMRETPSEEEDLTRRRLREKAAETVRTVFDQGTLREHGLTWEPLAIVAADAVLRGQAESVRSAVAALAELLQVELHGPVKAAPSPEQSATTAIDGLERPRAGWTGDIIMARAETLRWSFPPETWDAEAEFDVRQVVENMVADMTPGVLGGREFVETKLGQVVALAAHELFAVHRQHHDTDVAVADAADLVRELITDLAGLPNPRRVSADAFEFLDDARAWIDINANHLRQITALLHLPGALRHHPDYSGLSAYATAALYNSMETYLEYTFEPTAKNWMYGEKIGVQRAFGIAAFEEYDAAEQSLLDVADGLDVRQSGLAVVKQRNGSDHFLGVWKTGRGQVRVLDATTGLPAALPTGKYEFGRIDQGKLRDGLVRMPSLRPGSNLDRDPQRLIKQLADRPRPQRESRPRMLGGAPRSVPANKPDRDAEAAFTALPEEQRLAASRLVSALFENVSDLDEALVLAHAVRLAEWAAEPGDIAEFLAVWNAPDLAALRARAQERRAAHAPAATTAIDAFRDFSALRKALADASETESEVDTMAVEKLFDISPRSLRERDLLLDLVNLVARSYVDPHTPDAGEMIADLRDQFRKLRDDVDLSQPVAVERALRAQLAAPFAQAKAFLDGLPDPERRTALRLVGDDLPSDGRSFAVSAARVVHAARLYQWHSGTDASERALRELLADPVTRNVRTLLDSRVLARASSHVEAIERSASWRSIVRNAASDLGESDFGEAAYRRTAADESLSRAVRRAKLPGDLARRWLRARPVLVDLLAVELSRIGEVTPDLHFQEISRRTTLLVENRQLRQMKNVETARAWLDAFEPDAEHEHALARLALYQLDIPAATRTKAEELLGGPFSDGPSARLLTPMIGVVASWLHNDVVENGMAEKKVADRASRLRAEASAVGSLRNPPAAVRLSEIAEVTKTGYRPMVLARRRRPVPDIAKIHALRERWHGELDELWKLVGGKWAGHPANRREGLVQRFGTALFGELDLPDGPARELVEDLFVAHLYYDNWDHPLLGGLRTGAEEILGPDLPGRTDTDELLALFWKVPWWVTEFERSGAGVAHRMRDAEELLDLPPLPELEEETLDRVKYLRSRMTVTMAHALLRTGKRPGVAASDDSEQREMANYLRESVYEKFLSAGASEVGLQRVLGRYWASVQEVENAYAWHTRGGDESRRVNGFKAISLAPGAGRSDLERLLLQDFAEAVGYRLELAKGFREVAARRARTAATALLGTAPPWLADLLVLHLSGSRPSDAELRKVLTAVAEAEQGQFEEWRVKGTEWLGRSGEPWDRGGRSGAKDWFAAVLGNLLSVRAPALTAPARLGTTRELVSSLEAWDWAGSLMRWAAPGAVAHLQKGIAALGKADGATRRRWQEAGEDLLGPRRHEVYPRAAELIGFLALNYPGKAHVDHLISEFRAEMRALRNHFTLGRNIGHALFGSVRESMEVDDDASSSADSSENEGETEEEPDSETESGAGSDLGEDEDTGGATTQEEVDTAPSADPLETLAELAAEARSRLKELSSANMMDLWIRAATVLGPLRETDFGDPGLPHRAERYGDLRDFVADLLNSPDHSLVEQKWDVREPLWSSLEEWFNDAVDQRVRITGGWRRASRRWQWGRSLAELETRRRKDFERGAEYLRAAVERGEEPDLADAAGLLDERPAPDPRLGPLAIDQARVWRLMEAAVAEARADPERPARELISALPEFDARAVPEARRSLAAIADQEGENVRAELLDRAAGLIGAHAEVGEDVREDFVTVVAAALDPRRAEILAGELRVEFEEMRGSPEDLDRYAAYRREFSAQLSEDQEQLDQRAASQPNGWGIVNGLLANAELLLPRAAPNPSWSSAPLASVRRGLVSRIAVLLSRIPHAEDLMSAGYAVWEDETLARMLMLTETMWTTHKYGEVPLPPAESFDTSAEGPALRRAQAGFTAAEQHLAASVAEFQQHLEEAVRRETVDVTDEDLHARLYNEAFGRVLRHASSTGLDGNTGEVRNGVWWRVGIDEDTAYELRCRMASVILPDVVRLHDLESSSDPAAVVEAQRAALEVQITDRLRAMHRDTAGVWHWGFDDLVHHQWAWENTYPGSRGGYGVPRYGPSDVPAYPARRTAEANPGASSPDEGTRHESRWSDAIIEAARSLGGNPRDADRWRARAREVIGSALPGGDHSLYQGFVDVVADAGRAGAAAGDGNAGAKAMEAAVVAILLDLLLGDELGNAGDVSGLWSRVLHWHAEALRTVPEEAATHWRHEVLPALVTMTSDRPREDDVRRRGAVRHLFLDALAHLAYQDSGSDLPLDRARRVFSMIDRLDLADHVTFAEPGEHGDAAQRAVDGLFANAALDVSDHDGPVLSPDSGEALAVTATAASFALRKFGKGEVRKLGALAEDIILMAFGVADQRPGYLTDVKLVVSEQIARAVLRSGRAVDDKNLDLTDARRAASLWRVRSRRFPPEGTMAT